MKIFYIKDLLFKAFNLLNKSLLLSVIDPKLYKKYFQIKFRLLYLILSTLFLSLLFFVFILTLLISTPTSKVKTNTIIEKNILVNRKVLELEQKTQLYINQVNKLRSIINANRTTSISIKTKNTTTNTLGLTVPLKGYFTERFSPEHPFLDIVSKRNEKIKTVAGGNVIFYEESINSGKTLIVQHLNNLISVYKHCENVYVQPGNNLKKGQSIATVGNTGKLSSNYHLHLELWLNGKPINPEKYIPFK